MISKYSDQILLNKLVRLFSHITYNSNVSIPDTNDINKGSYILYDYRYICQDLYIQPNG